MILALLNSICLYFNYSKRRYVAAESWGDEEGYLLVFYLRDVSAAG